MFSWATQGNNTNTGSVEGVESEIRVEEEPPGCHGNQEDSKVDQESPSIITATHTHRNNNNSAMATSIHRTFEETDAQRGENDSGVDQTP